MRLLLPTAIALLLLLPLDSTPAHAHPWQQGSVRVSAGLGFGVIDGERTTIVGLGGGYNVVDGLELGLDVDAWFGGPYRITRLTPGAEYVLWFVPVIHPYVGTFYRRWFITDQDNLSSVGLRGGAYLGANGPILIALGIVHESFLGGCRLGCSDWYPEARFVIRF